MFKKTEIKSALKKADENFKNRIYEDFNRKIHLIKFIRNNVENMDLLNSFRVVESYLKA